ncbi:MULTISPECIES: PLP-dependent aminotransferase family protein [Kitasatospora]|uniref:Putative aminotransferase n=1 Tax=Kitasatospora setae (strain ATCC 33774 / DSM 43861 / JCM 3304 / KCC A-0304 / NBRC 14216 / KM-6054) TaxID=452652 RepID=E4N2W8_KITSK|nr:MULTISPECIES: PLP-dependent aminotransferase family protein [Kitasatospora]BAJ32502.1 putative aminotransferase [Kitasatospora setae KM-6054]
MTTTTETGATTTAEQATTTLPLGDLHASLADPLLDAMTFLNEVTERYPAALSFAPGRPHEGFFEPDDVHGYLDTFLAHLAERGLGGGAVRTALFQYGPTKGIIADLVARTLANDEGLRVAPESLVLTVGAQEGMLLVLRALCATPEDVLLVSSPCYVGVTGAARLLDLATVPVPEGPAGGPDPRAVREAARAVRASGRRPRALYVVPDFANPSGTSMPVEARSGLLEAAAEEGLLVIEDNPYGFFTREDAGPGGRPTLKALDRRAQVVYLGSFAKTCFPGARLGYVVADQRVLAPDGRSTLLADELAKLKSMTTVNTPALSQAVIGGMLLRHDCRLRAANAPARAHYAANMTVLLGELERHFPPAERAALGVSWNEPEGGFFAVLRVPFTADEAAMERCAREHGVLWTPMAPFYPAGGGEHRLRLSISALGARQIEAGVARLAAFIRSAAAAG